MSQERLLRSFIKTLKGYERQISKWGPGNSFLSFQMVLIEADKSVMFEFIKPGSTETFVILSECKYKEMEDEFIISRKCSL